ncbi:MAG TPA: hypothetical protein VGK14_11820 [Novimethylophilus sp.]|jgi:hypothetical protein|uniref:hypothetical protein n=1 Tax=Novimethylophilus sp. TaxID=2137426 RepID=UPI002F3FFAF0
MRFAARLLCVIGLAAMLVACDRLTLENYGKIKSGMNYDEVKSILGSPTKCSEVLSIRSCAWGDDKHHVNVSFVADQVVLTAAENLH